MSVHEFRPNGGYDGGREQPPEPPQMPPTDYVTHGEFQAAVAELKGEIKSSSSELRAEIHKWLLGTVLAIIGTMLAALFGIAQIWKSQPAPAAQPPIIINIPAPAPSK